MKPYLLLGLAAFTATASGQVNQPLESICLVGHLLGEAKVPHNIYTVHTNHGTTLELCTWQLNERQYVYQYDRGTQIVPDKDPAIFVHSANEGLVTSTEEISPEDAETISKNASNKGQDAAKLPDVCLVYASAMYSRRMADDQPQWIAIMLSPDPVRTPEEIASGERPLRHAVLLWEKNQMFYRTDTMNPQTENLTNVTTPQEAIQKYFAGWTLNNEQGG